MIRIRSLSGDERGMGAAEFALIAPAFLSMVIGITQLGVLYFANADLKNAVAAGARQAAIFPRPSTSVITAKVNEKIVKLDRSKLTGPNITYGTDSNGFDWAQIEASYQVPLNFVFFTVSPVTVTETRRVYIQPAS